MQRLAAAGLESIGRALRAGLPRFIVEWERYRPDLVNSSDFEIVVATFRHEGFETKYLVADLVAQADLMEIARQEAAKVEGVLELQFLFDSCSFFERLDAQTS